VPDKFIAKFESAEDCKGNFNKLYVAPSSKNCTVSIAAHGPPAYVQDKVG